MYIIVPMKTEISLTQQICPFIHIPYYPSARRWQLLKQGVCIAVEGHVLNPFGRSTGTVIRTGVDVLPSIWNWVWILPSSRFSVVPAELVSSKIHVQFRGGLNDVLHVWAVFVFRQTFRRHRMRQITKEKDGHILTSALLCGVYRLKILLWHLYRVNTNISTIHYGKGQKREMEESQFHDVWTYPLI